VARLEQAFESAHCRRKASEAAEAILTLDRAIAEWSADTLQTDEPDRARAILYSLVQRLGEAAAGGLRDPRELLLRWSRTSSPFEASCAPRAPSSSPTGCATA